MGAIQTAIQRHGYYSGPDSSSFVYYDPDNWKQEQLSVYWQFPIFWLSGVAEVVGNITTLELAYVGSPPSMKSLVMAFGLMTSCGGSLIGFVVNPFFTAQNMEIFMYVAGIIGVLFGPGIFFLYRNMKTGRDLMPELFEENLQDVGNCGANSPAGMVEMVGTSMQDYRPGRSGLEPGSKHAMDALASAKGAKPGV